MNTKLHKNVELLTPSICDLHVSLVEVLPDVGGDNVPQLLQVHRAAEVLKVPEHIPIIVPHKVCPKSLKLKILNFKFFYILNVYYISFLKSKIFLNRMHHMLLYTSLDHFKISTTLTGV